jgi:hypothetical protein
VILLPARRRQRGFIINPYAFGGGGGPAGDPYFSSVKALLHFDGANGSTTFTDHSSLTATFTRTGTGTISTAQSKFGGASYLSASASWLTSSTSAASYQPGSSDFTVEAWIYPTSVASGEHCIAAQWDAGTSWFFSLRGTDLGFYWNGTNFPANASGVTANNWHHVAATRSGNVLRLFANGAQLGSNLAITGSITSTSAPLTIGGQTPSPAPFVGHIDEFRYTLGIARYVGAYTTPTAAFPNF